MFSRLLRWLQPLFLLLAILAIIGYLASQWPALAAYPWQVDAGWMAAAVLLLGLTWVVEVAVWRFLLHRVGGRLGYLPAMRIWFMSAVVRYVPGNIWQPLSLTLYCTRYGIAPEATITSIALYQAIILLAAIPIGLFYLAWSGDSTLLARWLATVPGWLWPLALLPTLVVLARPQWLVALLNRILLRMGRPVLPMRLTSTALLVALLLALVDWLLWGATFAAFTFAVAGRGAADQAGLAPYMVASYPIAYALGFLSLITPSGFGVREGAFYLLLVPRLDGAVVTVVALAMRVWTTAFELAAALMSALFERSPARPRAPHVQIAPPGPPADADLRRKLT